MIIGAAPPERAGAASAISETCSEFGGALGIAILGSIGTAIYRRAMARSVEGIPREAAEAARDTLGGAVAAAEQVPGLVRRCSKRLGRHSRIGSRSRRSPVLSS